MIHFPHLYAWLPFPVYRGIFSLVFPGIPALRIPEKIGSQSAWNRVAPKTVIIESYRVFLINSKRFKSVQS